MSETGNPLFRELYRLIKAGLAPDAATSEAIAAFECLEGEAADLVWPFVHRDAKRIEGTIGRRVMQAAFGADEKKKRAVKSIAQAAIGRTVYKDPDGNRVLWDDLSREAIGLKLAQLRQHVRRIDWHVQVLECAEELLAEHDVSRLGDIEGWPKLVDEMMQERDASGPVVTP